ncbi:MAG: alpha/beta hydrolase [Clostridia bacterium]|nr:alpha/beta hydrolase [Clostridia bacterium]
MGSSLKTMLKIAAGSTVAFLAVGEVVYERILNRKYTNINNVSRAIDDDLYQYYGKPEDQVDGDAWFVAMHPEETVLVNSSGKTMRCNIFMQDDPTDKWMIVLHGYTSCPRGMASRAHYFYKKGYNILMPTLISFGTDESKYCTMGYHDRYYVIDWMKYIININPDAKIAILGESMGSATTMLVTGEENLPENLKCVVADCGFTSCWEEYVIQAKEMFNMPAFPVMHAANVVSKLRGNFDFKKCAPINAVSKSKTPTLFIHGEKDTFVPYWMMNKLFDACTAEKEKCSIPDAYHANSHDVHPEIYFPAIEKFLERYI